MCIGAARRERKCRQGVGDDGGGGVYVCVNTGRCAVESNSELDVVEEEGDDMMISSPARKEGRG